MKLVRKETPVSDSSASHVVIAPTDVQQEEHAHEPISFRRRMRSCMWHIVARLMTLLSVVALKVADRIGRQRRPINDDGCEIMLTGRFDSDNWILAHLGPLAASKNCSRLWMVSTNPVPRIQNVVGIYPPKLLMSVIGATPARLLTFLWAALRKRPHVVGGFHMTFNGVAAAIVGRLAGARSMYFCVGGPAEVCDGGTHSHDSAFHKMETADAVVESRFIEIISKFDIIITMGTKAIRFFQDKGVNTEFHVVSGGIDPVRFRPAEDPPSIDLILTGRLVRIKCIDVFLQAIREVANQIPQVKAVIVGEGRLCDELQALCKDLELENNVTFAGHQNDVESWLRKSKIFVLTSDSEGLSLSMMEAMMSGLPAIVSDVGDLGDLVDSGINGYLVPRRSPNLFAKCFIELLSDDQKLRRFSQAARSAALQFKTHATVRRWDTIIAGLRDIS